MTDHARKLQVDQDSWFRRFVWRVKQRDIALRLPDAIREQGLVFPARILFGELRDGLRFTASRKFLLASARSSVIVAETESFRARSEIRQLCNQAI